MILKLVSHLKNRGILTRLIVECKIALIDERDFELFIQNSTTPD